VAAGGRGEHPDRGRLNGLVFISGDRFDLHPQLHSGKARKFTDALLSAFDPAACGGYADAPGVQAWSDLGRRWAQGMPASWLARCDAGFREFLEAVYRALCLRHSGARLPEHEVTALRPRTRMPSG
jgi:hypothetical protein